MAKVYYDNCPGCIQELKNESNKGIPYGKFLCVWFVTLASCLPTASLFPFIYFMIRDFKVTKRVEDIGFYSGFVGASYMLGRALTSIFWGVVADRHGRKPVMVIGNIVVIIFNTLFGLSVKYWMAIVTRFLLGALNGLMGPIKGYSIEVCNKEYKALALSIVGTAWAVGLVIGPAIGGYLSQPAEKYPNVFSKHSIFARFPYCLPCLSISLFAVGALICCIWLPETLHNHKVDGKLEMDLVSMEANSNAWDIEALPPQKNLLKNWPLLSSIIIYCFVSLHDMAFSEIFPLWAESDKKYGGLSFSSGDVGQVLIISGVFLLVYQLFIYPQVEKLRGPIILARICAGLTIPLLSGYPFMTFLSGTSLRIVINSASVLRYILAGTVITGTFILQNNAVPQNQRGAANGIATTAMSLFRSVAPAVGGIIFSWAQKRQHAFFFPGDRMVFFLLNVVMFAVFIMTFKPFLRVPGE